MIALQGWWLASRRTYCEGCSHVRACAGKAGRQVLMHIRTPLNVTSLESDQGESGSSSQVISVVNMMFGVSTCRPVRFLAKDTNLTNSRPFSGILHRASMTEKQRISYPTA